MTQLDEAISRYNKLLETGPYRDLAWAHELQARMEAGRLTSGGRLLCPFLRPNLVMRRQYDALVKTSESLISAIDRMQQMVMASPALLARIELLPAEKMLAALAPGYQTTEVSARFDMHLSNDSMQVVQLNADSPSGVAYDEGLAELFYECAPVKDLRKKFRLARLGGKKHFLASLLKAYKQFGGRKKPNIAIVELRAPFPAARQSEYELFRDYFRAEGYVCEIVSPDQLEYRNQVLRSGSFEIDLVYRRINVQEFLTRFDLSHPLVEAYRQHKVCVVNSFRAELAHKKAMFGLLTDESLTEKFPAAERKAIREHVPWTRVVSATKTKHRNKSVDLLEFIRTHREKLVLKPDDGYGDQHSAFGLDMDQTAWERTLREAQRTPFVVQERVAPATAMFPLATDGHLELREMRVDLHPQAYFGKIAGCSSWLSATSPGPYSTSAGMAPTFILDSKG